MAANSKSVEDVTSWLIKVLESCVTKEQHNTARKLIRRFQHKELHKYHLPINKHLEVVANLTEVLNKTYYEIIMKGRMTNPEYPYNDPWWKSTPEDIKRWLELNEETKKITEYWNSRMTETPEGS